MQLRSETACVSSVAFAALPPPEYLMGYARWSLDCPLPSFVSAIANLILDKETRDVSVTQKLCMSGCAFREDLYFTRLFSGLDCPHWRMWAAGVGRELGACDTFGCVSPVLVFVGRSSSVHEWSLPRSLSAYTSFSTHRTPSSSTTSSGDILLLLAVGGYNLRFTRRAGQGSHSGLELKPVVEVLSDLRQSNIFAKNCATPVPIRAETKQEIKIFYYWSILIFRKVEGNENGANMYFTASL